MECSYPSLANSACRVLPRHLSNTELILQALNFGIDDLQVGDFRFSYIAQVVDRVHFIAYCQGGDCRGFVAHSFYLICVEETLSNV